MTSRDRLIRSIELPLAAIGHLLPETRPDGMLVLEMREGTLALRYDLRRIDLPAIECWLNANGIALSQGVWPRLRRRWIAFTDTNRRDQAAIVHQCCSIPPKK